jgi:hypothetical protein
MSTPNPALVAAAPTLITVIGELQTLVTTILTGDPLQIPSRIDGAVKIFLGQLELQFPGFLSAEIGVVETDAVTALGNAKTKLQALTAPATQAPAAK